MKSLLSAVLCSIILCLSAIGPAHSSDDCIAFFGGKANTNSPRKTIDLSKAEAAKRAKERVCIKTYPWPTKTENGKEFDFSKASAADVKKIRDKVNMFLAENYTPRNDYDKEHLTIFEIKRILHFEDAQPEVVRLYGDLAYVCKRLCCMNRIA